jgi:hypothetical protein
MMTAGYRPFCPVGYALNQQGNLCVGTPGNQTAPVCDPGDTLDPTGTVCIPAGSPIQGSPVSLGNPKHGPFRGPTRINWGAGTPIQNPGAGGVVFCTEGTGGAGCPGPITGTPVTVTGGLPTTPTNPLNPLNCTGYFVPNSTNNACVLSCPAGTYQDPSGQTCDVVCQTGYVPDTTNTYCVLSTAANASTTTISTLTTVENFFSNYWLYLLGAAAIYFVFFDKRRR